MFNLNYSHFKLKVFEVEKKINSTYCHVSNNLATQSKYLGVGLICYLKKGGGFNFRNFEIRGTKIVKLEIGGAKSFI